MQKGYRLFAFIAAGLFLPKIFVLRQQVALNPEIDIAAKKMLFLPIHNATANNQTANSGNNTAISPVEISWAP